MLGKIVGNSLGIILFLCSSLYAKIELRVTNMDGNPLTQAAIGEPFMLEVLASDTDSTRAPRIEGLDKFNVHNAGIQIRSINGDSSVKHTYKLRCDTAGDYVIGPAVLSVDSQNLSSDVVRIAVGEQQVAQEVRTRKKAQSSTAFLSLKLDKKEAFVGQKVTATLSFLYTDNAISLEHLNEPEFNNFTIGAKAGPITDTKTLNGMDYNLLKWRFELYPQRTGEYVIPACCADFLVQQKRDRFAGFSFLFGPRSVRKRVYSNAARLNVASLPPHDPPVEAIGSFAAFTAKIDPPIAKEGEGMVLSLCIEGDGNLEAISTPVLKNMPSTCKYYDSKAYLLDKTISGKPGKCFEYIVQALEGGDWEIPAQEFVYFDTKRQAYKMLKTVPLYLTIISPYTTSTKKHELEQNKLAQDKQVDDKPVQDHPMKRIDDLRPLNKDGAWYAVQHRSMSWSWFFLLIAMSLGYIGINSVRMFRAYLNSHYGLILRKKGAFGSARKKLKVVESSADLYLLFIELFAARAGLSASSISQQSIEIQLNQVGMSSDQVAAWNQFLTILAEQIYSIQETTDRKKELFEQAQKWLDRLEKVL